MATFLAPIAVGILCIVLGLSNRKGNIDSLHSYHRKRVKEEDKIPFGKQVGLGMILIGIAIIVNGVLSMIAVHWNLEWLTWIGMAIMFAGLIAGTSIAFAAMKKYNKGIF